MSWFYSAGGEQKGPVEQAEFESLIATGVIRPETLVWQPGMPNWQSAADTRPDLLPPALPGAGTVPAYSGPAYSVPAYSVPAYMTPQAPTVTGRLYAGFWIRVLARLIDFLVLMVPSGLVVVLVVGSSFFTALFRGDISVLSTAAPMMVVASLINAVMAGAYEAFTTSTYGGTLGKLALGLRVILPNGGMLNVQQALIRYLLYYAGTLIGLIPFIGLLGTLLTLVDNVSAAFDPQKRTIHDRIAHTFVVKK